MKRITTRCPDYLSSRTWRANPTAPSNDYDFLYGYDGLQRVTSGTRGTLNGTKIGITSPQFGQCWTLDSTGNWQGFSQDDTGSGTWDLQQTRSASPVNEITSVDSSAGESWATPQYDPTGNMTTVPRPALPRPSWANLTVAQWSNLTVDQWAQMEVAPKFGATYDAWNRLVKLTDGGTGQTSEQYQYDGRNYRTVVQSYTSGTLSETRHAYYTDNWQCVEERLGISPDTANPDRQFVWGIRYIDDLVCRDRSVGGSTLNERLYGCQDANWNMTAVVDTSGAIQERCEYDPYGNSTFLSPTYTTRTASSYSWETLYGGYQFDATSGLYSVRNRYYHPRLGAWLTRDPLGYLDSFNPYEYCGPNSPSMADPSGLDFWSIAGSFAAGFVVGAVSAAVIGAAVSVASPAIATGILLVAGAVAINGVRNLAIGIANGTATPEQIAFSLGAFTGGAAVGVGGGGLPYRVRNWRWSAAAPSGALRFQARLALLSQEALPELLAAKLFSEVWLPPGRFQTWY